MIIPVHLMLHQRQQSRQALGSAASQQRHDTAQLLCTNEMCKSSYLLLLASPSSSSYVISWDAIDLHYYYRLIYINCEADMANILCALLCLSFILCAAAIARRSSNKCRFKIHNLFAVFRCLKNPFNECICIRFALNAQSTNCPRDLSILPFIILLTRTRAGQRTCILRRWNTFVRWHWPISRISFVPNWWWRIVWVLSVQMCKHRNRFRAWVFHLSLLPPLHRTISTHIVDGDGFSAHSRPWNVPQPNFIVLYLSDSFRYIFPLFLCFSCFH